MKKYSHIYWFVVGFFIAGALVYSHILAGVCVVILLIFWGEYWIPVSMAILLDSALASFDALPYFFGVYTVSVLVLAGVLLPMRKHLNFS